MKGTDAPYEAWLNLAANCEPEAGRASVFIVNRSLSDDVAVNVSFADRKVAKVAGVDVLTGDDPKEANSWERPDAIAPIAGSAQIDDDGCVRLVAPSLGLAAVRLELAAR